MESRLNENEADGPYTRTTSPDGKYVWLADPYEVRMSHYIFVGELWQKSPAAILLKPADGWSFEQREWTSATRLQLHGRRYPGSRAGIVMTLDVETKTGMIESLPPYSHSLPSPAAPAGAQPFALLNQWLTDFPND